jgi:hypothetical protein
MCPGWNDWTTDTHTRARSRTGALVEIQSERYESSPGIFAAGREDAENIASGNSAEWPRVMKRYNLERERIRETTS